MEYTRSVNEITTLTLVVPNDPIWRTMRRDWRIEVWRTVGNRAAVLDTDTSWWIRDVERSIGDGGTKTIKITAYSSNELLNRRIIAYNTGTPYTNKAGAADDVLKAIVRENCADLVLDPSRRFPSFTVAQNRTAAAVISKVFGRDPLASVLKEITDASYAAKSPLYFDVLYQPATKDFLFQTYIGQRGNNRRFPNGQNPVIVGPAYGTIEEYTLSSLTSGEITFVYCGGKGEGDNRLIQPAGDTARLAISPYNRREQFADARDYEAASGLLDEAQGFLREGRPKRSFAGRLVNTVGNAYGIHWGWGDVLTAEVDNERFDCRVDTVKVSLQNGEETIEAWLRYDE